MISKKHYMFIRDSGKERAIHRYAVVYKCEGLDSEKILAYFRNEKDAEMYRDYKAALECVETVRKIKILKSMGYK